MEATARQVTRLQQTRGETIHAGDGRTLRVLEVVPTAESPSTYVGMLRVGPAYEGGRGRP